MSVLHGLGPCIPMIPVQAFLDYLSPPQPDFDLNATIQSLKLGSDPVLTSSNRWSRFPKAPKDSQGSEDGVFGPMSEIFTKVVVTIVANSSGRLREENCTIDFLQNPNLALASTERCDESRPDGYLVLKDRNKRMSTSGMIEDILWADIVLSCEYKREDGDEDLDDVRIHQGL